MAADKGLKVVFGTGPLGLAVMEQLVANGQSVKMVNRSGQGNFPEGVETAKGDASDPASARETCEGATVVYNCVNAPYDKWPTMFPSLQAGIIEGAASAGAKLVSAENTYMYGEVSVPETEDLPYAATTRKGKVRAQMAETLMDAHNSGKVRAAIGRASDFYGPHVRFSAVGERAFYPVLEGRKASVIGNLDVPHTYTYIKDFGRGLVELGERDEALGEIWHIPSAETLTTREFLTIAFEEAGHDPQIGTMPKSVIWLVGLFNSDVRELREMYYEFDKPFIVDHGKYERTFGNESTPAPEAIRETLYWFRDNPKR